MPVSANAGVQICIIILPTLFQSSPLFISCQAATSSLEALPYRVTRRTFIRIQHLLPLPVSLSVPIRIRSSCKFRKKEYYRGYTCGVILFHFFTCRSFLSVLSTEPISLFNPTESYGSKAVFPSLSSTYRYSLANDQYVPEKTNLLLLC